MFLRHVVCGKERVEHDDHCSRISYLPEDNGVDPSTEDPGLFTQNEDPLHEKEDDRQHHPHERSNRDLNSGQDVGRDVPFRFSHRGRILKSTRKWDYHFLVPTISRGKIGTISGMGTSSSQ